MNTYGTDSLLCYRHTDTDSEKKQCDGQEDTNFFHEDSPLSGVLLSSGDL